MNLLRFPLLRRASQAGFSLITAIFLVVVLAGLGGAIINITVSQRQGAALDVVGVRAYQAARAGIEWGLYQKLRNDSCAPTTPLAMPAGTTLSVFTVTVTCAPLTDGGTGATVSRTATTTANSTLLTMTGVSTTANMVEGMRVFGSNIPPSTFVYSIDSLTTVTLTSAALAGGAASTFNFYSPLDQWDIKATACNLPTGGVCLPINNSDYVQRVVQVRF
jgi:MSHA biogenesis protein MshP